MFGDGTPQLMHFLRGKPPHAARQHHLLRLDLDVVAAPVGLLSVLVHVRPEMPLVGRFVGRETDVAVDAIGAVLRGESGNRFIELPYCRYHVLHQYVELRPRGIVHLPMRLEPLAVIVRNQLAKEGEEDFVGTHNGYGLWVMGY